MGWCRLYDLHGDRSSKEATRSLLDDDKIYLYGHDAKTMKHFTLYFDSNEQCDALDRAWFGEMWFPVQRHNYHVQSLIRDDCVVDPADLDLEWDVKNQIYASPSSSRPSICSSR